MLVFQKTLIMHVFSGMHCLLTDEQLAVESNKTFSVCKGQGTRGQLETEFYIDTDNLQKLRKLLTQGLAGCLLAIVLSGEMVIFKVVKHEVFLQETSGQLSCEVT